MNLLIEQFLRDLNEESPQSPSRLALVRRLIERVVQMAEFDLDEREMVVAAEVLDEMLSASEMFARWREQPKLTIFGSARTSTNNPLYQMAKEVAEAMAQHGWMTVNGAGGGIMEAASIGAGISNVLGVNIELPFEQHPSPYIDAETRLVMMRYFFTRKAALTRPASAFVVFPGGFGTMDELFEVLTLMHTGKTEPAPIVLVDVAKGEYWQAWLDFLLNHLVKDHYIEERDLSLLNVAHSKDEVISFIIDFYRNFKSIDIGREQVVITLDHAPNSEELDVVNKRHPLLGALSGITKLNDQQISVKFDGRDFVGLHAMIRELNSY